MNKRTVYERPSLKKFPKLNGKKSFIKSYKTDRSFEIDGFCEKLKIGFEYQGELHYRTVKSFCNDVMDTREKDRYKASECKRLGVLLLQIPYYKLHRNMKKAEIKLEHYVRDWVVKNNITHLLQNPPSSDQIR